MSLIRFIVLTGILFGFSYASAQDTSDVVQSITADSGSIEEPSAPAKSGESKALSDELKFVDHLITSEAYDDARFILKGLYLKDSLYTKEQNDSIYFHIGWLTYFNQEFYPATAYFKKVSEGSPVFLKAKFYESICYVYQNKLDTAKMLLNSLELDSSNSMFAFRNFQLGAIALLERDYEQFKVHEASFGQNNYLFATEEDALSGYAIDMEAYKEKSALLAGLISALVPGLGKFYTGYRGLPFGAMFTTLPLAAIAIEAFIIGGVVSPVFWVLGGIFGVFYIGNIWGSALSVKARKIELYEEFDHNIKFDMHIPIRRIFE